jgi:hypothetical protein
MKVTRVDLAEAVAPDTVSDTGAPCPYGSSLSFWLACSAMPLTWEYFQIDLHVVVVIRH